MSEKKSASTLTEQAKKIIEESGYKPSSFCGNAMISEEQIDAINQAKVLISAARKVERLQVDETIESELYPSGSFYKAINTNCEYFPNPLRQNRASLIGVCGDYECGACGDKYKDYYCVRLLFGSVFILKDYVKGKTE